MGHISYATCSKARQVSAPDRGAELICRTFFSINGIVKQSTESYTSTAIESAFLRRLVDAMVVIIHLVLVDHAVVSVLIVIRLLLELLLTSNRSLSHVIETVTSLSLHKAIIILRLLSHRHLLCTISSLHLFHGRTWRKSSKSGSLFPLLGNKVSGLQLLNNNVVWRFFICGVLQGYLV